MEGIRIDKKIEGIAEVRDETDREGLRIVIDLKSGANKDFIINYLLKNTELQISYNYNMVAIVNRTPKTLGILEIIDAYIAHLRETITKRTEFDLAFYKKNYHIIAGLIKAISILDEVIKVIRASKNKADAKENLVKSFDFTMEQAEAIVTLQLYRLTNTDIVTLEEESKKLEGLIQECEEILNDEAKLKGVMKSELRDVKRKYANPRKTQIVDEITEIKVDLKEMIPNEKVVVVVTNDGYVKRVSLKSYNSTTEETALKPGDFVRSKYFVTTQDTLLLFTNLGNYLYVPVHKIAECKWKDLGKHISNTVVIKEEEKIVASMILKDKKKNVVMFTKNGLTKQVTLKDFEVTRYSKPMMAIKLKNDDELVNVTTAKEDTLFVTHNGFYLRFKTSEIPVVGVKASGVKGINLKEDYVIYGSDIKEEDEYLNIFTNMHTGKRIKLSDLSLISRAKKGNMLFKKAKTKDYKLDYAYLTNSKDVNLCKIDTDIKEIKNSEIPIMDITSTGSVLSKKQVDLWALKPVDVNLITKEEKKEEEVKEQEQLSFNDFVKDFKI